MIQRQRLRIVLLAAATACVWMGATSCESERKSHDEHSVWFVHATDPHLYLYLKDASVPQKKTTWEEQQKQDEETFKAFLKEARTVPENSGAPSFLLITGDFGVDPCLNLKAATPPIVPASSKDCLSNSNLDTTERGVRVAKIADLLAASPVSEIYFVAGNNDLPLETASDEGIGYFNQFFQEVQDKITPKNPNVHLHNLTGCYGPNGGAISECAHDIPGTSYRIIGFPSQSLKNRETKTSFTENRSQQAAQFNTFRGLFDRAVKDGRRIIIATHTPEMDDPYYLAQRRYANVAPPESENQDKDKDNPRSIDSTWNVEKTLLDDWTKVLSSDSVVAVLAGHLHDDHKEIYKQPYAWSTLKEHQLGYRKLFLAPPLSVKNQDGSPIQARGFSAVNLAGERVETRFFWYDGVTGKFSLESLEETQRRHWMHRTSLGRWIAGFFGWLWDVDAGLDRIATFFIALLTAFLTVVALWQIPPTDDPLVKKPGDDTKTPAADSSPFSTRIGKTVLAGLGGFVAQEVVKTLGTQSPGADLKWYYVICFISWFFALLLGLNFLRALAEALRARLAVVHYPLARPPKSKWFFYWSLRVIHWIFSLRVPLLTFFDTFINLIQGKNQTTTQAFAAAVVDQQRNVIRVASAIRKNLTALLRDQIGTKAGNELNVRVNISVLSADQSSVYYISRSVGSSLKPFSQNSVAWISVFTGKIRWFQSFYKAQGQDLILYDNTDGTIASEPHRPLTLGNYYEGRQADYQAFVIFPVPQPQRGAGSDYVKGAIHISFDKDEAFQKIWSVPQPNMWSVSQAIAPAGPPVPPVPPAQPPIAAPPAPPAEAPQPPMVAPPAPAPQPPIAVPPAAAVPPPADQVPGGPGNAAGNPPFFYPDGNDMLDAWCKKSEIKVAIIEAVAVLGELLRGFNEVIFENCIKPDQGD